LLDYPFNFILGHFGFIPFIFLYLSTPTTSPPVATTAIPFQSTAALGGQFVLLAAATPAKGNGGQQQVFKKKIVFKNFKLRIK